MDLRILIIHCLWKAWKVFIESLIYAQTRWRSLFKKQDPYQLSPEGSPDYEVPLISLLNPSSNPKSSNSCDVFLDEDYIANKEVNIDIDAIDFLKISKYHKTSFLEFQGRLISKLILKLLLRYFQPFE